MSFSYIGSFLLLFFLLASCQESEKKQAAEKKYDLPEVQLLKPLRSISNLADSVFLSRMVHLTGNEKHLVFIDYQQSIVALTDKSLALQYVYYLKGKGPGELSYPDNPFIQQDTLYIEDSGNYRINAYSLLNGTFLYSFKIPLISQGRKAVRDTEGNWFFATTPLPSGKSIYKISPEGKVLQEYGDLYPSERFPQNRQFRYVQLNERGEVISLGVNSGFLDIYASEGKLLKRYDISGYEPVKRALDSTENDIRTKPNLQDGNTQALLFTDSYYYKGRLYASFTDRLGNIRKNVRHILVFKLLPEACILETILKFDTGTTDDDTDFDIRYIDPHSHSIYVQAGTAQLYEFSLPEFLKSGADE